MTNVCVGCGAPVDDVDGPVHAYMTSAPACWARYGELLACVAGGSVSQATRVMCADSYAAQHPGTPNPQAIRSVGTHLVNIYRYVALGQEVTIPSLPAHGLLHWLEPPSFSGSLTVFDVPTDADADALRQSARAWATAVWHAWAPHHGQVAAWHEQLKRGTR